MTPTFAATLGFMFREINIDAQKIDGFFLKI